MNIEIDKVSVTTVGSAGSAVGSATTLPHNGILRQVYLNFHASAPNTTDTTLVGDRAGGTILSVANSATDAYYVPVRAQWAAGAAVVGYSMFAVNESLTISLAQCDALTDAVVATFWFEVD